MTAPKEIPELVTELVDLSRQYLRQETIEPAKRLGRFAGFSLGAGIVFAIAGLFLGLGAFALARRLLPDTPWWSVGARLITTGLLGGAAGVIGWRMTR